MPEYIRVKDKETGHHLSIDQRDYDRDPSVWERLASKATYADGTPLPPKYKTTVSTEAAKKGDQTPANKSSS